ncbi:MAG: FkbM family methyltransferase [Tolypothrix carrinoi HA7290-LM1]|jgi:FkbM family methyltransferase|nr:FkbM family methyltransferase [Tolypothrix carrinoi HA7290-LM1]
MNPIEQPKTQQIKSKSLGEFFFKACEKIGIWQAITYKLKSLFYPFLSRLGINIKGKKLHLSVKTLQYPVYCRYGTSDSWVFNQIFIEEEYSGVGNIENVNWIVDCGANVGYSAVYFLNKYPQARIIVIEPDPDNFELCSLNLAPYGKRANLLKSAVWSSKVGLVVDRPLQDNGEWGIEVRPCKEGETPDLNAIDIQSVFEQFKIDKVDILKVDIEKAELSVFSCNYQEWLNKVNYIAIELHGKECEEVFFKAISSQKYDSWSAGELTYCKIHPPVQTLVY